jgi:hypothetical protein
MDWADLDQDRDQWRALVNMVMIIRVSYSVQKYLDNYTIGGFSRTAHLHGAS